MFKFLVLDFMNVLNIKWSDTFSQKLQNISVYFQLQILKQTLVSLPPEKFDIFDKRRDRANAISFSATQLTESVAFDLVLSG